VAAAAEVLFSAATRPHLSPHLPLPQPLSIPDGSFLTLLWRDTVLKVKSKEPNSSD
jgi:hypothetical protein